jgi:molybdopterin-dependent oxidoreductase alpha subunit
MSRRHPVFVPKYQGTSAGVWHGKTLYPKEQSMANKRPEGIREYNEPAGGWGALKAVAEALKREQVVVQAAATLLKNNQPDGFDCPGCAWPDPKHTSAFEFCENGAKAVAWESTAKRVDPSFFSQFSVAELWEQPDHWLEGQGRLTTPLRYNSSTDHFEPVGWDEVLTDIGGHLRAIADPDKVEFYTSGRASNEAAFMFQLFARAYGTNNFPDCSNMCHEPTSVGLPQSIGVGKGTVSLGDFDHADLILSIGHNPGTNHPRMMTSLHDASRRGATILVINPFKERALQRFQAPQAPLEMATDTSVPIASDYFQVRIGGDAAALKGICKALLDMDQAATDASEAPVLDHAFLQEHTLGFEGFATDLAATEWPDIVASSGLTREAIESIARAYAHAPATIICYGMGITQHRTGTSNVHQIANLLLLKGNIGRPGAGVCPLRGHSNVQGNRTVGITERPKPVFLDRMEAAFKVPMPRAAGHSVVESIAALRDGRSKAIICLGGNLAIAAPDPTACFAAFRRTDLAVSLATKLNRTHLLVGKATYILPVIGRTEQDVQASGVQSITVEDSMSMVHASKGFLTPPGPLLRSEPWIIAAMAQTTLGDDMGIDWSELVGDYALIRDKIEAVFPEFEGFNARLRTPGGFHLPNAAADRSWDTPSGKANFMIFDHLEEDELAKDPDVLRLATMRSHDQYNTTIYGLDDRYRGVFGRRDILFLSARDGGRLGFAEGDRVDVETALSHASPDRIVRGLMVVTYDLPDGCCAAYYPETQALVALDHVDRECLTPSYKSIPVRLHRAVEGGRSETAVEREGLVGHQMAE